MSVDKRPPVTLHYHPYSRAAAAVVMLEAAGAPYELHFVDMMQGEQKSPEYLKRNPMGKIPAIEDSGAFVTEAGAIGLYLADRYAYGTLAPKIDDPARGTYLRWSFFAPSVIEPGCYAEGAKWEFRKAQAGWGDYPSMLDTISAAIGDGPFLLGERFTMADIIFGGTVRFMLKFKMLEARPEFEAYVARLSAQPAFQAGDARNAAECEAHGLKPM